MGAPSVRRSGRRAAAKRSYTEDPFEAAGLDVDSSGPGTPSKTARAQVEDEDDISDDEFVLQEDDGQRTELPSDQGGSYETEEPESLEEGRSISEESTGELGDVGSEMDLSLIDASPSQPGETAVPEASATLGRRGPHNRGLWNPTDHLSKGLHQRLIFGSHPSDKLSYLYNRDRWSRAIDVTFPSRRSLGVEYTMSSYGVGRTFGVDEESVINESTKGWDWYYEESVGGQFRKRQKLERIGADEGIRTYIPKARGRKHTVLLGPVQKQKVYELEQGASLNFGDAWGHIEPRKKKSQEKGGQEKDEPMAQENASTEEGSSSQKVREGWILNIGQKVNCLDWAPNQEGNTQYLAISTLAEQTVLSEDSEDELEAAPAFSPSESSPASIQIWSFEAKRNDDPTRGLDMRSAPNLRAVICTDWGEVRQLSWCPMTRAKRKEDDDDTVNLGLLAGIWRDGNVRVLAVQLSKDVGGTEYIKFKDSCFTARPPSTVCTCVTWLSPSDIAVGCANGFVAVWSLATLQADYPRLSPKPYIYVSIHLTYILNVVSAYPTYPHLLATTAMDGQTRMLSLFDPQKDAVDTTRMRLGSPNLTYSPYLRSFLSSDENDFLRLLPVRRFFTTATTGKNSSQVTAMANSSRWHPSLLAGGTDGSAIATNPLRSLLHPKEKHYQQRWFLHEWVPGKDGSDGEKSRPEASRFMDGFKAMYVNLLRNMSGDDKTIDGIVTTTIYDEPRQVTALAWNPNYICSGWASAGLGCGLVRVEDLAI